MKKLRTQENLTGFQFLLLAAVLIGVVSNPVIVQAGTNGYELRSKVILDWSFQEAWKLKAGQLLVDEVTGKDLCNSGTEVGLVFEPPNGGYCLSLFYHYAQLKNAKQQWITEHRPYGNLKLKGTFNDWKWSNRTRIEYRDFDSLPDYWCLRNKTKLLAPVEILPKVKPYTAYEYFYNLSGGNRHWADRIYGGVEWTIRENFEVDLHYFYMNIDTSCKCQNRHALGMHFKVSF